jgi:hypothetical protein
MATNVRSPTVIDLSMFFLIISAAYRRKYIWFVIRYIARPDIDGSIQVHRGPWNSVKVAYLMCRYYPLLLWPIFVWSWVGNHPPEYCARLIHPLYCLVIPFVSLCRLASGLHSHRYISNYRRKVIVSTVTIKIDAVNLHSRCHLNPVIRIHRPKKGHISRLKHKLCHTPDCRNSCICTTHTM